MSKGLDAGIVQYINDNHALYVSEYEKWKELESAFDDALNEYPDLPVGNSLVYLENTMTTFRSQWVERTLIDICDIYNVDIANPERFIAGPQELAAYVYEQIGSDLSQAVTDKAFKEVRRRICNYVVDTDKLRLVKEDFNYDDYDTYGTTTMRNLKQMKDFEHVMREVLNDPFTFDIEFNRILKNATWHVLKQCYTGTYKTPGSMIKSLSIFRNGSLKITFHNEDDLNDFTSIIPREYEEA